MNYEKIVAAFSLILGASSISFAQDVTNIPNYTCEYNYSSEGQQVSTTLQTKTLSDPYGKLVLEMVEAKSKQLLFTFDILKNQYLNNGSLSVTMRGNYEGIAIPASLVMPLDGQVKSTFDFYGELTEIQCSPVN